MRKLLFLFIAALLACGCQRIDPSETFSKVPSIDLLSVGPTEVQAYRDSIVFEIEYIDGDGDLGTNDDTQRNVFVKDLRIDITHSFRLQQLAPDGANIPIKGSFRIVLPNTLVTMQSSTEEKVIFSIFVVDRAGNESNSLLTPEITVRE